MQGVCWCPAETRVGLLSSLAGLRSSWGRRRQRKPMWRRLRRLPCVGLPSNARLGCSSTTMFRAPDEIADLLPSAGARVLITSRFSDWGGWADEVALDVLPLEEAVALLQSRTGRSDAAGAKVLAEALGNLPLALDHAAAYCKRTQMRFADYAVKASSLIAAAPRGAGYPRSVAATFDLAITEAVAQCPAAEPLMAYLAQCSPERIPMTLIEGAIEDEAQRLQALAALAEVSLVKHDPFEDSTPAVTVHRLVQTVARARSEANGSAHDAVGRLIARLVAIYPEDGHNDPHSWPLCAQLTPHLLARRDARSDDASDFTDWAELLDRAGSYFHGRAAHSQAAQLFRDALAICEKTLGPEHPDTATSLNNLAVLLPGPGRLCSGAAALRARAGDPRKGARPRASRYGDEPQQPRHPAPGPGRLCGGAATLRARAGDPRKGARPRASRYGDEPQQPRQPAPGPGRLCGGAATLRARTGHPRKGASAQRQHPTLRSACLATARQPVYARGDSCSGALPYTTRCTGPYA